MSEPMFIYKFKYGDPENTATVMGHHRPEARRKVKTALGWWPDDLLLTDVTEVTE